MVGFGKALAAQLEDQPEWREHYLAYNALKKAIKACHEAAAGPTDRPALARLLDARKAIFQGQLDAEVLKVLRFYKSESAALLEDVQHAAADVRAEVDPEQLRHLARSLERASALHLLGHRVQGLIERTTRLLQFVSTNMVAVRKILKKFAKNVGGATNEPVPGFVTLEIEHPDDPGWHVLQGSYLPATAADDLRAMQEHAELKEAMGQLRLMFEEVSEARRGVVERASMRLPSEGENALGAMADQMAEMERVQEEAARHAALVHAVPWVERAAGMFEPPPPDRFAVATLAGLVLNNLSTLLFMANYTAVLPPTDALCVRIGVPSSYTGLIMAASDLAALFASVGISFWTQRSFKQPLLFAAAACLAGNVLFVLSYSWRSLPVLLAARLLNGCGSARTANRRYTADYVSKAQRTMASAAFVGASNLGMALGPLLSLPLAYVPDWQVVGLPVNSITSIGWAMAAAWLLFILATALWFPEPPARLPIGLARDSMLLPELASGTVTPSAGPRSTVTASRASSTGSQGAALQAPAALLDGRPGADSKASLHRPLLETVYSGMSPEELVVAATVAEAAAADLEAAAGQPAPEASQPLLPHARRAEHAQQQQAAALRRGKPGKREAAAGGWRATVPGTVACTLALLVQKMVQQAYLDSLPLFTEVLLSWSSSQKGLFLGLVSLAMVPVNAAVGAASARVSDRLMVCAAVLLCTLCLAALAWAATLPVVFFAAGVLLFVGTVVLEGTATSLMSKVIWSGFAMGVLNAGLLSTEAGTLGRFVGNGLLAGAGKLTGLASLSQMAAFARLLFLCLAAACVALLGQLACTYRRLQG